MLCAVRSIQSSTMESNDIMSSNNSDLNTDTDKLTPMYYLSDLQNFSQFQSRNNYEYVL